MLTNSVNYYVYLPIAELIAKYFGPIVTERMTANCSPDSIVRNL